MVSPPHAPRLLVVDDNDLHRRGLSRFLRRAGYAVDEQADAVGALKRLVDEVYDGVLTDISLPDVDGLELLREIRKRDLEVPVVLVTGRPALETAVRGIDTQPTKQRVVLNLGCDLFQGFLVARPARPFPTVAPVTPFARSGTDP